MNVYPETIIEQNEAACIALDVGTLAMRFSHIERVPRYDDGRRENDAEHSFMLAMVAPEIATALRLPLDVALVHQFATVHDLIELKTGDVATFTLTDAELADKEAAEHRALAELAAELPLYNRGLLLAYEAQAVPEARFVRAVDKLLPLIVDIAGDGRRVMEEDYDLQDVGDLWLSHYYARYRMRERFGAEFPAIAEAYSGLCAVFEGSLRERPNAVVSECAN